MKSLRDVALNVPLAWQPNGRHNTVRIVLTLEKKVSKSHNQQMKMKKIPKPSPIWIFYGNELNLVAELYRQTAMAHEILILEMIPTPNRAAFFRPPRNPKIQNGGRLLSRSRAM